MYVFLWWGQKEKTRNKMMTINICFLSSCIYRSVNHHKPAAASLMKLSREHEEKNSLQMFIFFPSASFLVVLFMNMN